MKDSDHENRPMIYGYAQVSTDGQSVAAQIASLTQAGAGGVCRETISEVKADHLQLCWLLDQFDPGDVLLITRLDRLARSTRDWLNSFASNIESATDPRSLSDTWANTVTAHGGFLLTVRGRLAEFERELMRIRTGKGRESAIARGVKISPRAELKPYQQREAIPGVESGEATHKIVRTYKLSHSTISRLAA